MRRPASDDESTDSESGSVAAATAAATTAGSCSRFLGTAAGWRPRRRRPRVGSPSPPQRRRRAGSGRPGDGHSSQEYLSALSSTGETTPLESPSSRAATFASTIQTTTTTTTSRLYRDTSPGASMAVQGPSRELRELAVTMSDDLSDAPATLRRHVPEFTARQRDTRASVPAETPASPQMSVFQGKRRSGRHPPALVPAKRTDRTREGDLPLFIKLQKSISEGNLLLSQPEKQKRRWKPKDSVPFVLSRKTPATSALDRAPLIRQPVELEKTTERSPDTTSPASFVVQYSGLDDSPKGTRTTDGPSSSTRDKATLSPAAAQTVTSSQPNETTDGTSLPTGGTSSSRPVPAERSSKQASSQAPAPELPLHGELSGEGDRSIGKESLDRSSPARQKDLFEHWEQVFGKQGLQTSAGDSEEEEGIRESFPMVGDGTSTTAGTGLTGDSGSQPAPSDGPGKSNVIAVEKSEKSLTIELKSAPLKRKAEKEQKKLPQAQKHPKKAPKRESLSVKRTTAMDNLVQGQVVPKPKEDVAVKDKPGELCVTAPPQQIESRETRRRSTYSELQVPEPSSVTTKDVIELTKIREAAGKQEPPGKASKDDSPRRAMPRSSHPAPRSMTYRYYMSHSSISSDKRAPDTSSSDMSTHGIEFYKGCLHAGKVLPLSKQPLDGRSLASSLPVVEESESQRQLTADTAHPPPGEDTVRPVPMTRKISLPKDALEKDIKPATKPDEKNHYNLYRPRKVSPKLCPIPESTRRKMRAPCLNGEDATVHPMQQPPPAETAPEQLQNVPEYDEGSSKLPKPRSEGAIEEKKPPATPPPVPYVPAEVALGEKDEKVEAKKEEEKDEDDVTELSVEYPPIGSEGGTPAVPPPDEEGGEVLAKPEEATDLVPRDEAGKLAKASASSTEKDIVEDKASAPPGTISPPELPMFKESELDIPESPVMSAEVLEKTKSGSGVGDLPVLEVEELGDSMPNSPEGEEGIPIEKLEREELKTKSDEELKSQGEGTVAARTSEPPQDAAEGAPTERQEGEEMKAKSGEDLKSKGEGSVTARTSEPPQDAKEGVPTERQEGEVEKRSAEELKPQDEGSVTAKTSEPPQDEEEGFPVQEPQGEDLEAKSGEEIKSHDEGSVVSKMPESPAKAEKPGTLDAVGEEVAERASATEVPKSEKSGTTSAKEEKSQSGEQQVEGKQPSGEQQLSKLEADEKQLSGEQQSSKVEAAPESEIGEAPGDEAGEKADEEVEGEKPEEEEQKEEGEEEEGNKAVAKEGEEAPEQPEEEKPKEEEEPQKPPTPEPKGKPGPEVAVKVAFLKPQGNEAYYIAMVRIRTIPMLLLLGNIVVLIIFLIMSYLDLFVFFYVDTVIVPPIVVPKDTKKGVGLVCRTIRCGIGGTTLYYAVNHSVEPCDSMFKYVCERWIHEPSEKYQKVVLGADKQVTDDMYSEMRRLVESYQGYAQSGHVLGKLALLYRNCEDFRTRDEAGARPLNQLMHKYSLNGWPYEERFSGKPEEIMANYIRDTGSGVFVSVRMIPDPEDPQQHAKKLVALECSTFVLPIDMLLTYRATQKEAIKAYKVYISSVLEDFQHGASESMASNIFAFEVNLAHRCDVQCRKKRLKKIKVSEISQYTDKDSGINWAKTLKTIMSGVSYDVTDDTPILVRSVAYFKKLGLLFRDSTTKTRAMNYLGWRFVQKFSRHTTAKYRESYKTFQENVLGQVRLDDWMRCLVDASDAMPLALGRLYVQLMGQEAADSRAYNMVVTLLEGLRHMIGEFKWVQGESKEKVSAIMSKVSMTIGYPTWLMNDTALNSYYSTVPTSGSYLELYAEALKANYMNQFKSALSTDVPSKMANFIFPSRLVELHQRAGPPRESLLYDIRSNHFAVPSGVMNPPYYVSDSTWSMNFGGLGVLVAKDLVNEFFHALDAGWMAESERLEFKKSSDCVLAAIGKSSRTGSADEAVMKCGGLVGDLLALRLAYTAYHAYADSREERTLPGMEDKSPDQVFFVAAFRTLCTQLRERHYVPMVRGKEEVPELAYLDALMRSMNEFTDAFSCPDGMYRQNVVRQCLTGQEAAGGRLKSRKRALWNPANASATTVQTLAGGTTPWRTVYKRRYNRTVFKRPLDRSGDAAFVRERL
ncbi:hypothetical protein V5799_023569 [Amblyomma americanum]|uniref:M13 family peptidase n=1 Tax=Amblyomma americanum TaxID=6943 RepID=A0AAQ4FHI1_AMBAM